MRLRLIFGSALAVGVILLMALDAWLSAGHQGEWLRTGLVCTGLVLALTGLAVRELLRFAVQTGHRPLRFESYFFAYGLVLGPYVSFNVSEAAALHDESWGMAWMAIALGAAFLAQAMRRGVDRVLVNLATTLFIVFYAGGLFGFMTKLRMEIGGPLGAVLLVFSMFVVKMTDVGAYFVGTWIGRHKAVPWLSPSKSWEGFAGGVLVAMGSAVGIGAALKAAGWLEGAPDALIGPVGLLAFGFTMSLFSIAGDLAESLLKRDVARKDSGNAIPGMGGFLDVVDSAMLSAPAAWFFWTRVPALVGAT